MLKGKNNLIITKRLLINMVIILNVVCLQAQNYVVRNKGIPINVENILQQEDNLKSKGHDYLSFKIKNVDQAKKITEASYDVDGQTFTMTFPNHGNFTIDGIYGFMSPDKKWAIAYGSCEVLVPANICNDPIYLANLATGNAQLISVDNHEVNFGKKDLDWPVAGFNATSAHFISVDNKGLHGWDAINGKEIWKISIKDIKKIEQMTGTDYAYVIFQYKRAQEGIMVIQTSTGKKVFEDKTGTYNISAYYDAPGNSLYYKCPMESYCKKISMITFNLEKTFYNNIIPFDNISFYGNRKWVRFSNGTDNVMFNTETGDRLNWSSKMANYSFMGANGNGEESIPFYESEFMIYHSDEFWLAINRKTGHFLYENKFGNSLTKFAVYKDSIFESEITASSNLYDKTLLSKGFTEDGKGRLVERMAKCCPKIVNANFLNLLDPLMLETKDRIVTAMKKNIAGWAFVHDPTETSTNQKVVVNVVKSYPAGVYCVPMLMQKVSTGLALSVSYACIYVQVTTNSPHTRDEIVTAAKQVRLKEYSTRLNGYNDYEMMFFEKACNDCKDMVNVKYSLSDFQVTFTTLP